MKNVIRAAVLCGWAVIALTAGANPKWRDLGSEELEAYFAREVAELEGPLEEVVTLNDWKARQPAMRKQLLEMLGLDPMPERTPLKAVVTGTVERGGITVENVHFQSSPGLYVTGNLYLPNKREGKVPAVLYVCGHGGVKIDGVSYGNKVHYQHHGVWFARNGYACLVIDSLQLGEIEAIHHGTYRYGRWWWIARGYTPAGVEAWNCTRALDYLQSREEIDGDRLGVTGRSGGGAYSWWISAIDERIKASVPVAGIASMRNHVVDGCVEGHCDCMYQHNTYRWDYEQVASLVAPRALLISNTDKDSIFPLDGVYQVYRPVRRIYDLHGAAGKLGLNIEEGPHKDTQPLRTSAFHWMNRHLKGTQPGDTYEMVAVKMFDPRELKVFEELPADEINTKIDERFVAKAPAPAVPKDRANWNRQKKEWMRALQNQSFRGWPQGRVEVKGEFGVGGVSEGVELKQVVIIPESEVECALVLIHSAGVTLDKIDQVEFRVVGEADWPAWTADPDIPKSKGHCIAYFCPRGVGKVSWDGLDEPKKRVQIRRRFALIGQTLDGMRVWDILQGLKWIRGKVGDEAAVTVEANGIMAGNALYASLFLDLPVASLTLHDLPASHREGPIYFNVLRYLDLPQAVAMAAERSPLTIHGDAAAWEYPKKVAARFEWPAEQIAIKVPVPNPD